MWYGFNISFWLITSFSLVLVIIFSHEFAAGKKREPRISLTVFIFFLVSIGIGFFNIWKMDDAPWRTGIRRLCAAILVVMLLSLALIFKFDILSKIGWFLT